VRFHTVKAEASRHVTLSSARGIVMETEQVRSNEYILRCHKSSSNAAFLADATSWIGFRYSNAHWSFMKSADEESRATAHYFWPNA